MPSPSRLTPSAALSALFGLAVLASLYLTSLYSYLLFHSLAEFFSIVIAFNIFILAWNSQSLQSNSYLLFLGSGFFYVACFDLLHTLAYKGMGIFAGYDADLPTQLWIAARGFQTLILVAAPLHLRRKMNSALLLGVLGLLFALLLATIFFWHTFPTAYVEGVGQTAFKINAEYAIVAGHVLAFYLLYRQRAAFEKQIYSLLVTAFLFSGLTELMFTTYVGV
ncbi:MAG: MASE3 domain-containing protein, partial [Anaerolineaceae bacterium]|nr:MASE3 domain-containing protein [Anaerolineaceae bacterium]